jgi:hypothetical protein
VLGRGDELQPLDCGVVVQAVPGRGPLRGQQPDRLVEPQRGGSNAAPFTIERLADLQVAPDELFAHALAAILRGFSHQSA